MRYQKLRKIRESCEFDYDEDIRAKFGTHDITEDKILENSSWLDSSCLCVNYKSET